MQQWAIDVMATTPVAANDRELVVAATFARGTSTVSAIRRLAKHGFGVHALMLCRSLFEDALTATWIAVAAPQDLIERHDEHDALSRRLMRAAEGREPSREEVAASMTAEERARFGNHAHLSWTGRTPHEQLREVGDAWGDESSRAKHLEALWLYHRRFQRLNNTFLHHSPMGIAPFYEWPEGEPLELKIATTDGQSFDALANAVITYGFLLTATIDYLAPEKRQELDALRTECLAEVDGATLARRETQGG